MPNLWKQYEKIFHYAIRIGTVLLFVWWTAFVYQHSPEQIISMIGDEKSYGIAFILAFLGGLSPIISIPYYLVIMAFGATGLNPYLLGLAGGIGVILGDSMFYAVGYNGKDLFSERFQEKFQKFFRWCVQRPFWLMSFLLFLYGALVPLPNTLIVISMGLMRFSYWKAIVPLALGNIVFNTAAALIGVYGVALLQP